MTDVLTNVNPVVAPLLGLCLLLGYGNYYAVPRAYQAARGHATPIVPIG